MARTAPDDVERPTYARLVMSRGFPGLMGVSLANILGVSLQILALTVLVYRQTGSALWSSAAFAAGFLPQLLGGFLLTSLADRWPARPVLAAGAVLRAATAFLLAVVDLPAGVAIGVVALVAVVSPVPAAAQSAMVARLLTGELYVLGRSVFNLVSSVAQLAGLAVGGTVVAVLGPDSTFAVSAGVQLLGLLAVAALPRTTRAVVDATRWRPGETWHANAALLRDHVVRRILLSWWLPSALLVGAESLVVAYVGEQGYSTASTGVLLAAFPAGAAVGDIVVGRWFSPGARRRSVPWLLAAVGVGLLPFALAPTVPVATACFAVASAATAYQLGGQQTFLAALPTARQGVAFGLLSTGMMTGQGIVPVLSGALADVVGVATTITVLGGAVLVAAVFLGRLPEPRTDRPASVVEVPQVEIGIGQEARPVLDQVQLAPVTLGEPVVVDLQDPRAGSGRHQR